MKQDFDKDVTSQRQDRLLTTLEGLLELPATEVKATLNQATSLIAEVLAADKVDVFFHDPASETLVALGTSDSPMGWHRDPPSRTHRTAETGGHGARPTPGLRGVAHSHGPGSAQLPHAHQGAHRAAGTAGTSGRAGAGYP